MQKLFQVRGKNHFWQYYLKYSPNARIDQIILLHLTMGCREVSNNMFIEEIKEYWLYNNGPFHHDEFEKLMGKFQAWEEGRYESQTEFCSVQESGRGIIYKVDKSFYYGQISDKKAEGEGHVYYRKYFSYQGLFKNGIPDGQGSYFDSRWPRQKKLLQNGTWEKGKFIQGEILNSTDKIKKIIIQKQKKYRVQYQNNFFYEGSGFIQENQFFRDGQGTLINSLSQQMYKGSWKRNKRDGEGEIVTKSYTFKGEFRNDKKSNGTYETKKYICTGEWNEDGKFEGKVLRNTMESGLNDLKIRDISILASAMPRLESYARKL